MSDDTNTKQWVTKSLLPYLIAFVLGASTLYVKDIFHNESAMIIERVEACDKRIIKIESDISGCKESLKNISNELPKKLDAKDLDVIYVKIDGLAEDTKEIKEILKAFMRDQNVHMRKDTR
jgi:hypothetical protein